MHTIFQTSANKQTHTNLDINEAKEELRTASLYENDQRICMELPVT